MSKTLAGIWIICAFALTLSGDAYAGDEAANRGVAGVRHLILITIDNLRADHLGCNGHEYVKTPHLDEFAKQGILFEQHIVAAPHTLTSHVSTFTGTYPHTHGVLRGRHYISDENVMLTEVLGEAGFATAGFPNGPQLTAPVNFSQGFDHFDIPKERNKSYFAGGGRQRRGEQVTDTVLSWLDTYSKGDSKDKPLFLFAHYFDPHAPYVPPRSHQRMYREGATRDAGSAIGITRARGLLKYGYLSDSRERFPIGGGPSRAEPPSRSIQLGMWAQGNRRADRLKREYAAEVTYADEQFGRLLEGLKQRKLLDQSLVIVMSDHGETFDEHADTFRHGYSVYDSEIHTPLIIRFPNGKYGGRRESTLVSSLDVMPSVLDWLNLKTPKAVEGISFARVTEGKLPPRKPVFAEATGPRKFAQFNVDPIWPNNDKAQCVRTERYKYMSRAPDKMARFYDLKSDPTEQNNLLERDQEYDKKVLEGLKKKLAEWRMNLKPLKTHAINKESSEKQPKKQTKPAKKSPAKDSKPKPAPKPKDKP